MNRKLLTDYGLKYTVLAAGATVGALVLLARFAPVDAGLVALGLLGVAGVVLVLTLGGSGGSTAAMANQPGQSRVVGLADVGVGSEPGRGVRVFFFAVGLAAWAAVALAILAL